MSPRLRRVSLRAARRELPTHEVLYDRRGEWLPVAALRAWGRDCMVTLADGRYFVAGWGRQVIVRRPACPICGAELPCRSCLAELRCDAP